MESNFISLGLVKNIVCVVQETYKFEPKKSPQKIYSKVLRKREVLGPLGVEENAKGKN
jgi:hypothetical protein